MGSNNDLRPLILYDKRILVSIICMDFQPSFAMLEPLHNGHIARDIEIDRERTE